MTASNKLTDADHQIAECLASRRSFSVIAGAGAGKTTSLVTALRTLLREQGEIMLRDCQKAVCITYTNRAADVIRTRLRDDPRILVSTLHSFLWSVMRGHDRSIREMIRCHLLPAQIEKQRKRDKGGNTKASLEAREKAAKLEDVLEQLDGVTTFRYGDDTPYSDFVNGEVGHDDLLLIAAYLITTSAAFRAVLSQKHPFLLVDEAQDTSPAVVDALNVLCGGDGLPVVGYFGDPMQQIYDKGEAEVSGPKGSARITKVENYRSGPNVIQLLNAFRKEPQQVAGEENSKLESSVAITLVRAEEPEEGRRYSDAQLERAMDRYREAIDCWGWAENDGAKQLYLARRMIARRLGFLGLHDLFNGQYASQRAKNDYESGEHYLLRPLIRIAVPIAEAYRAGDTRALSRCLTEGTIRFMPQGLLAESPIDRVKSEAERIAAGITVRLGESTLGDVVRNCRDEQLFRASDRLSAQLDRVPREESYDEELHATEKGDWLADELFSMGGGEVEKYCDFLEENTPFSTQHGVKGEEYDDVVVVFDDTEASWSKYSFTKTLTPGVSGEAKDSQRERSRRIAYVCFSRAMRNLRVLLFTPDPEAAKDELVSSGLFQEDQASILD